MSRPHKRNQSLSRSGAEDFDTDWIEVSNNDFGGTESQTAGVQLFPIEGCNDVLLAIRPPPSPRSTHSKMSSPFDLIVLLDVSHNMSNPVLNSDPGSPFPYLYALDLAKDTIRCIIDRMGDQDRLSILTFHARATVVEPLQFTSKAAKKQIAGTVQHVQIAQGSSMMSGICTALNLLPEACSGRSRAIYVMSSGRLDNVGTDDIRTLEVLLQTTAQQGDGGPMISTFGIGSVCDSNVLHSIATVGKGTFSLIEDQDSMNAAVSHGVAELHHTFATSAKIEIEWNDGEQRFTVPESTKATQTGKLGLVIDLGFLEHDRPHMILISGSKHMEGTMTASMEYHTLCENDKTAISELNFNTLQYRMPDRPWVARVHFRTKICNLLWRFFAERVRIRARYQLGPAFKVLQNDLDILVGSLTASQHRMHPTECNCDPGSCEKPITDDIEEMYQDSVLISRLLKDDQVRFSLSVTDSRTSAVLATFLHAHMRQMCTSLAIWMVRPRIDYGVPSMV